jgi:hypothetical protein
MMNEPALKYENFYDLFLVLLKLPTTLSHTPTREHVHTSKRATLTARCMTRLLNLFPFTKAKEEQSKRLTKGKKKQFGEQHLKASSCPSPEFESIHPSTWSPSAGTRKGATSKRAADKQSA